MKLTCLSDSFFPFPVPEKDASFAANVGPRSVYPAGFSLDRALQIFWRARTYHLLAAAEGTRDDLTQSLGIDGPAPARNAVVTTSSFVPWTGPAPASIGDLVLGFGLQQTMPGTGTLSASGPEGSGTNDGALLNLQVNLFYPAMFVPDPVIRFDDLWWPAMSISCLVVNTVELDSGGSLSMGFDCTTLPDDSSPTEIGTFSFFGVPVPVYSTELEPGETRTFSGAITVQEEWP